MSIVRRERRDYAFKCDDKCFYVCSCRELCVLIGMAEEESPEKGLVLEEMVEEFEANRLEFL